MWTVKKGEKLTSDHQSKVIRCIGPCTREWIRNSECVYVYVVGICSAVHVTECRHDRTRRLASNNIQVPVDPNEIRTKRKINSNEVTKCWKVFCLCACCRLSSTGWPRRVWWTRLMNNINKIDQMQSQWKFMCAIRWEEAAARKLLKLHQSDEQ